MRFRSRPARVASVLAQDLAAIVSRTPGQSHTAAVHLRAGWTNQENLQ